MRQIEIILRTTDPTGKVTEQLLARFDTVKPATESDEVLQYSGLCIDPIQHQVSYEGNTLPLTETYEFQTLVYLASQPGRVFTKEQIYQAVWKEEGLREQGAHERQAHRTGDFRKDEVLFQVIRDDVTMISDMAKNLDVEKIGELVKIIKKAKIIDVYGTDNSANAAAELSGSPA